MKKIVIASTVLIMLPSLLWAGHHGSEKMHKHATENFKRLDTNNDGNIDRAEFMAQAEKRFASMDTNSDGLITPEEGKAAHKKMREEHRKFFKKHHWKHHHNEEASEHSKSE